MTPRIVGLLSFYDEQPSWLSAAITSHANAVDHIVAVDGAYGLYPGGKARSSLEEHEAIASTCYAAGLGLTLHTPDTVWYGNEVEKRSFMFSLAETVGADWYFVIDADHLLTDLPFDLRDRLAATDLNAAQVRAWERRNYDTEKANKIAAEFAWDRSHEFAVRLLFRALPGLHCEGNHYTYVTGDGRKLWGNTTYEGHDVEDCLDLTDLRVEHRTQVRDLARRQSAKDYYRRRDRSRAEASYICHVCRNEFPETRTYPTDFSDKDGQLTFGHVEACVECGAKAIEANIARLKYLGMDPDIGMAGAVQALASVNA